MQEKLTGVVKKWMPDYGYGFLTPADGSGDLFVHFKQIEGGKARGLNIGENVTYTLGINPSTGNPMAENVVGDGSGKPRPSRGGYGAFRGRGRGRGAWGGPYGGGGYGGGFGGWGQGGMGRGAAAWNGGGGWGAGGSGAWGGGYGGRGAAVAAGYGGRGGAW